MSEHKVIDDETIFIDERESIKFSRRKSHKKQYVWYQEKYPHIDDEYYWKYPTIAWEIKYFVTCQIVNMSFRSEETYIRVLLFR